MTDIDRIRDRRTRDRIIAKQTRILRDIDAMRRCYSPWRQRWRMLGWSTLWTSFWLVVLVTSLTYW